MASEVKFEDQLVDAQIDFFLGDKGQRRPSSGNQRSRGRCAPWIDLWLPGPALTRFLKLLEIPFFPQETANLGLGFGSGRKRTDLAFPGGIEPAAVERKYPLS